MIHMYVKYKKINEQTNQKKSHRHTEDKPMVDKGEEMDDGNKNKQQSKFKK